MISKKRFKPSLIACSILFSVILTGCSEEKKTQSQASNIYLELFKIEPLTYDIKIVLPGRVVASETAEIRPQVSGIILKRFFKEGSNVKAGDSLYQIDPAIYQAQLEVAQANVESAAAQANVSHLTLNRYKGLLKTRAVSQQDYDQTAATAKQADAALSVAKANLNSAQVNLNYTKVESPISGYIGKSNVTAGSLVSASQSNDLAVVQKMDPIYVDMTQAATQYQTYQSQKNVIFKPVNKVELIFNDGSKYDYAGTIKFLDKAVNETTGTVTIRSQFKNPEGKILAGMFVKPQVTIGTIENALIVPQAAITINAMAQYQAIVAVPVKPNEKDTPYRLEMRTNLQVYKAVTGYWVITQGLNEGEFVVTNGGILLQGKDQAIAAGKVEIIATGIKTLTQEQLDKITSVTQ